MNPNENTEPAVEKSLADRESEITFDVFAERIRKAEAELKRLNHEEDLKWKRYEIALLRSREALYRLLAVEDESAADDKGHEKRLTEMKASVRQSIAESDTAASALGLSDAERVAKRDLIEKDVEEAVLTRLLESKETERVAEASSDSGFPDRVRSFSADRNRMRELEALRDKAGASGEKFTEAGELRELYGKVETEGKSLEEEYRKRGREGAFLSWIKKGADEKKIPSLESVKGKDGRGRKPKPKAEGGSGEPDPADTRQNADLSEGGADRSAETSHMEPSSVATSIADERLHRISVERAAVEESLAEVRNYWNDSIRRLRDAGLFNVTGATFETKRNEEEAEYLKRLETLDAEERELKSGLGKDDGSGDTMEGSDAAVADDMPVDASGNGEPVARVIAPMMTEKPEDVPEKKDEGTAPMNGTDASELSNDAEADPVGLAHEPVKPEESLVGPVGKPDTDAAPGVEEPSEPEVAENPIEEVAGDETVVSGESGEEPEPVAKEDEKRQDSESAVREEKAVVEALHIFTSHGLNADRLLGIEGYHGLSGGQRLLLAENFRQVARERGEEKAKGKVEASHAVASGNGVVRDLFAKIRAFVPRDDNMRMAKARREVDREEGWQENREILADLLRSMEAAEFRPQVDLDEDGRIDGVRFLSDAEFASFGAAPESESALRDFNVAARVFSRMPYEWSLGDAKKSEHARYGKAERAYLAARERLAGGSSGEVPDPKLVSALARADRDVELMRMFASDPDTENIIGKISGYADRSKVLSFLKTNVFEKGGYYAFGFLKPMLAAGAFGFIAVPAVSGALGAFRARGRARQELRDAGKSGRRGAEGGDRRRELSEEYGRLRADGGRSVKEEKRFRKLAVLFGDGFDERFGTEFAELSAKREEWEKSSGPWSKKEGERYAMLEAWKRDEEEYVSLDGKRRDWKEANGDVPWTGEDAERFRELSLERRTGYGTSHPERRDEVIAAYADLFGTTKTYVRAGDRHDPEHPSDGRYVKHGLSSKLERLAREAADADDAGREETVGRLRARIAYTRKRLDEGMIDFGGSDARTKNRTDLVLALSRAEAAVAVLGADSAGMELGERLEAFLEFGDRKTDAAERAFIRKRMRDGAIVSATFGIAGSATRHFAEVWQGESELLPGFLSGENVRDADVADRIVGSDLPNVPSAIQAESTAVGVPGSGDEALSSASESAPVPEALRAAIRKGAEGGSESFVIEAKPGEGLTHLARHAADRYLSEHPDPDITAEHRIYIEDYLRRHSGFSGTLHPDDSVEFSLGNMEKAVAEAKTLDPARLENLSPYADRVSAFEDLPRFRTDPSAEVSAPAVEETLRTSPEPSAPPITEAVPAEAAAERVSVPAEEIRTPFIREYIVADEGRESVYFRNMATMRESVFVNFDADAHGAVKAGAYLDRLASNRGNFSDLPETDRAFARLVTASYGELRSSVALSDAEADRVLLPGEDETVDAYFERISFVLVKKRLSVDSLMKAAEGGKDDDVIQFLGEKGLLGGK